jgi:hypothetical protein
MSTRSANRMGLTKPAPSDHTSALFTRWMLFLVKWK